MLLEAAAGRNASGRYRFVVRPCRQHADGGCLELDWEPLLREVLDDRRRGVDPAAMAMRFHRAVAAAIAEMSSRYRELPVVLAGGVFQNRLLTECVIDAVGDVSVLGRPGVIPPNDGGLAVGQLVVALQGTEAR